MKLQERSKGVALAATGASLWGINGTFADAVFSQFNAPVEWVVGTRLLMGGLLILLYAKFVLRQNVFNIFKSLRMSLAIILFAFIGMVGSQYMFFLSIGTNGAGVATILQFASPIFIYIYLVTRKEKAVYLMEVIYIIFTFIGVFLIVAKGNIGQLNISLFGLLVGIGSAIAVAFYTIQPRQIIAEFGSPIVVGWGMLLGGTGFQFVQAIWQPGFEVNMEVILYMAFIVIIGTAIAFTCYLASVNYIDASLSNILASLEPLVANVLSVVLLGQRWSLIQMVGILIVIVSMILFANYNEKTKAVVTIPERI